MTAQDGHSYERAAIEGWFRGHATSPKTGAVLVSKILTPNHALRNAIEEWQRENCQLIPRAALTFRDPEDQIGTGSFKRVFKATLRLAGSPRAVTVAALQVRNVDVAAEATVLLRLGKHPRLVTFIGQCRPVAEDPRSDMILITEFAPMGSLDAVIEDVEDEITLRHKVAIMMQVASGMEALADQKLIHRDLAMRNVLVFGLDMADVIATSVKVSDFGLTVNAFTATHKYVQGGALPIRYLAPESLQKGRYSEQSDVWAFGVTCWELLTNGRIPYWEITNNDAVSTHVVGGGRLARPIEEGQACPDGLWELVASCWAKKPKFRPGFTELGISLAVLQMPAAAAAAAAPPFEIFVKTLSGGTYTIEVTSDDTTVGALMRKIQDKCGTPPSMQRLIFAGKQLQTPYVDEFRISSDAPWQRGAPGGVYVVVKTITGENYLLDEIEPSNSIEDIKAMLAAKDGTPTDQMRLYYDGRLLEDHRTLQGYNILRNATLHMLRRPTGGSVAGAMPIEEVCALETALTRSTLETALTRSREVDTDEQLTLSHYSIQKGSEILVISVVRGDIGVFGAHDGTNGATYLDGSTPAEAAAHADVAALIVSLGGDPAGECQLHPELVVLGPEERAALVAAVDAHHSRVSGPDVKLKLTEAELEELIGREVCRRALDLYDGTVDEILVRRTQANAASDGAMYIQFHTDYNVRTMQVVLNDASDYVGGELTFATSAGFCQPRRAAGSATIHSGKVVHGVTTLRSGVRYGLFFLEHPVTAA